MNLCDKIEDKPACLIMTDACRILFDDGVEYYPHTLCVENDIPDNNVKKYLLKKGIRSVMVGFSKGKFHILK